MVITRIILHLDWKEFTRVRSDTGGTCGTAEYVKAGAGATGAAPMCVKAATPSAACVADSPVEDVHTNDRQPPRLSVESSVSACTPNPRVKSLHRSTNGSNPVMHLSKAVLNTDAQLARVRKWLRRLNRSEVWRR